MGPPSPVAPAHLRNRHAQARGRNPGEFWGPGAQPASRNGCDQPRLSSRASSLDVAFVPAGRVVAALGQVRGLAHGADIPAEDDLRALLCVAAAAPVAQIGKRPQHQAGESDDHPVHHPLPVAQGVRSWRSRGSQILKVHRRGESERAEAALVWANTAAPDKRRCDKVISPHHQRRHQ